MKRLFCCVAKLFTDEEHYWVKLRKGIRNIPVVFKNPPLQEALKIIMQEGAQILLDNKELEMDKFKSLPHYTHGREENYLNQHENN